MAQQTISARVRQRRRRRLAIMIATGLLVLAIAYYGYLLTRPSEPAGPIRPPGTIEVPVAAREVPMGDQILRTHLRSQFMPPAAIPPDALINLYQITGRVALRRVPAGAYLRETDLAPPGAPAGLSGLARAGTRIVVVETGRIGGYPGFLRSGDRVDVLAIGSITASTTGPTGLAASNNTVQGGGVQPGDSNAPSRRARRQGNAGAGATSATLISEDAEVLQVPNPRARPNEQQLVLSMTPDDAHVTTLALASGQSVRLVYRRFDDRTRTTPSEPVGKFTHVPRDPRAVEIIYGVNRHSAQTAMD